MTSTASVRWGILGAARINDKLLPAIVEAEKSELVAIASRRAGAAKSTLDLYYPTNVNNKSDVKCFDELESLINSNNIDAVYIPSANNEHVDMALRCLAAKKHVLIEKPLALSVEDIDRIEKAAHHHNLKVMEGFMYHFHPQHARVRELIASGVIGELRSARSSFSFLMSPKRQYRISDSFDNGGGALWDVGVYSIHTLRHVFGVEPRSVVAQSTFAESGADTSSSGVFDFGSGRYGHFETSFERTRQCKYEILGTKGGVSCEVVWQLAGDVPIVVWWTDDGRRTEERLPVENHFKLEVQAFVKSVVNDSAVPLPLSDARANCKCIRAIMQSVREKKLVTI